jgi:hypothetical protein
MYTQEVSHTSVETIIIVCESMAFSKSFITKILQKNTQKLQFCYIIQQILTLKNGYVNINSYRV